MQRPTWQPIPAEQLQATLSLQQGKSALTEVRYCRLQPLEAGASCIMAALDNSVSATRLQAEKGVPVASAAYQVEDMTKAVKKEKKSGKRKKAEA